jgi:hypothetical protein
VAVKVGIKPNHSIENAVSEERNSNIHIYYICSTSIIIAEIQIKTGR